MPTTINSARPRPGQRGCQRAVTGSPPRAVLPLIPRGSTTSHGSPWGRCYIYSNDALSRVCITPCEYMYRRDGTGLAVLATPSVTASWGDKPCCGPSDAVGVVTADELLDGMVLGRDGRAKAMLLPTIQCVNCIPIGSTTQYWCVLRPDGTDCSPSLPFNNNFRRKRWLYWYDCPGDDIGICCSLWQNDGCCNSSDEEPPCSGGGATHRYSEVACP